MATHLLAILLLAGGRASAAGLESEIDTIDAAADDLAGKAASLEREARPGNFLSEDEAVVRFQDCLFLHLIGQHAAAAEGFFALVTTGALVDAGMHRDAEWYLAESLSDLGNYQTAAARFKAIVDEPDHPFHDEAVRRLLEIYADTGDDDAFKRLYDAEIVPGKVKPTGEITYSLAKSFYKQGDLEAARGYFLKVPADNAWYGRARYFLGVIDVAKEDFDGAKTYFGEVAQLSVQTTEDREVQDLAKLALGRIAYHQNDYEAATAAYSSISGDSRYHDEQLYELVWTSIRREQWQDALENVEIFLLAYPDHEKAAQLRLLQGHLNFQEKNWNDALVSYEQVVEDYKGVRDRFDQLARSGPEADDQIARFLQAGSPDLPPYAVAMMKADPDLGRTLDVFADLQNQKDDLEASERLISELQAFLAGAGAASSFQQQEANAHSWRLKAVEHELSLLDIEERWLAGLSDASLGSRITPLQQQRTQLLQRFHDADGKMASVLSRIDGFERDLAELRADVDNGRRESTELDRQLADLEADASSSTDAAHVADVQARIAGLQSQKADADARVDDANRKIGAMQVPDVTGDIPAADIASLGADVAVLYDAYSGARPASKPGQTVPDRLDADQRSLNDTFGRLGTVLQGVESNSQSQLGAVKDRFDAEVAAVAQERADYQQTSTAARSVSLDLTRQGFGRLEDFFADSVLKADMGIVDVYWAQKIEIDDQLTALKEEKDATVAELERRFTLIREKMGEGGK